MDKEEYVNKEEAVSAASQMRYLAVRPQVRTPAFNGMPVSLSV